jgi:hypothetical protein
MSLLFATVRVKLPLPVHDSPKTSLQLWTRQSSILKQCPAYPSSPAVQAAVADCDAAAAELDGTLAELDLARVKVQTLEQTRNVQLGTLHIKHDAVGTACTASSNNDLEAAHAWTGNTVTRTQASPLPVGTDAPLKPTLNVIKRHSGSVMGRCDEDADAIGYLFQYGTDPNHPEGWPPAIQMRGHTFTLRNLPVGQVLCMRIAILRRGSVTGAWSAILQVTVR